MLEFASDLLNQGINILNIKEELCGRAHRSWHPTSRGKKQWRTRTTVKEKGQNEHQLPQAWKVVTKLVWNIDIERNHWKASLQLIDNTPRFIHLVDCGKTRRCWYLDIPGVVRWIEPAFFRKRRIVLLTNKRHRFNECCLLIFAKDFNLWKWGSLFWWKFSLFETAERAVFSKTGSLFWLKQQV